MLQQMAGLVKTPQERRQERYDRHIKRQGALIEQQMVLVDKIKLREQGDQNTKPMPFAKRTVRGDSQEG